MPSRYANESVERPRGGLLGLVKSVVLTPIRIALSKTALRAYLTTILVVGTGITLLGVAIAAYVLFYWSYIPRIGFERPINLQFDNVLPHASSGSGLLNPASAHPYGVINLYPDIVGAQVYDVAIELTLPRTPENVEAGNFMLEAKLLAPNDGPLNTIAERIRAPGTTEEAGVLASSRRSAILQYRSPLIDLLYKLTEVHWYMLNVRSESDRLRITMFEGVEFSRGWRNVPRTMRVEVQSTGRLRIYTAKAVFRARFQGLRWVMYNYRFISAAVFISGFWMTELVFAGLAWAVLAVFAAPTLQETKAEQLDEIAGRIKNEPAEDEEADTPLKLSDTERTFPTLSGQQPLHYQPQHTPSIKHEQVDDGEGSTVLVPEYVSKATEADAEDEEEDEDEEFSFRDSGLGTGVEGSGPQRGDSVKRRRGRTKREEE
ncbi:hypothetical protein LTR62_002151 [Meristemomyces frigidus]|uniref:Seipin n=1 Tax=Meristemomyces frigidus TaxID=1508187 RepID=A0AAN7T8S6_9PEZI|nr:hypothetical protein LTR62_002151 [Meristemomyces frigidus]